LHFVGALVLVFKSLELLVDVDGEALAIENLLHPTVNVDHVSLLDVVLVTESFVEHGTDALD